MKQLLFAFFIYTGLLLAQSEEISLLNDRTRDYDQLHVDLHIKIDFDKQQVIGQEAFTFVPLTDTFKVLRLHSLDTEIKSIVLGKKELKAKGDSGIVYISLPKAYTRQDTLTISFSYIAKPQDGLLFFKPLPNIPGIPYQVWSQGEGTGNRHWYLAYDFPDDKLTTDLTVDVPAGMISVSNGDMIESEQHADGSSTQHWQIPQPQANYLTTLIVGEFATVKEHAYGVDLYYHVPKEWAGETEYFFGKTPSILRFFSDYIIPYPYKRYAQTTVWDFLFGGMENSTATTMNRRLLYTKDAMPNYTGHDLVAHEFAHQWWGDLVTCKTWEHGWLNEGFATYFTCLWDRYAFGNEEYETQILEMMDQYKSELIEKNFNDSALAARFSPPSLQDDKAYHGGAVILHMLKNEVGETIFREGCRNYIKKYLYGAAVTKDFITVMEETAGRPLQKFSWQWLRQANVPEFSINTAYDDKNGVLTISVSQPDTAVRSFLYKGNVPLRIEAGGMSIDTLLSVGNKQDDFHFSLQAKPDAVYFNYRLGIVCREIFPKSADELAYIIRYSESAVERIKALRSLRKPNQQALSMLASAYRNEDNYKVRIEIVKTAALAQSKVSFALLVNASEDVDARVREAALDAMSNFGNFGTLAALRAKLPGEKNEYCRAAIYRSYGKLHPDDVMEYLKFAMNTDSHRQIIRRAVFEALGDVKDNRALNFAGKMVEYNAGSGDYHHVELAALAYAEKFITSDRAEVVKIVMKGLENPYFRTRNLAAEIVEHNKLTEAASTLKGVLEDEHRNFVRPTLEKALKAIQ